jgi:hypothetical protein
VSKKNGRSILGNKPRRKSKPSAFRACEQCHSLAQFSRFLIPENGPNMSHQLEICQHYACRRQIKFARFALPLAC